MAHIHPSPISKSFQATLANLARGRPALKAVTRQGSQGKYLNLYHLLYENQATHQQKIYETVSRDPTLTTDTLCNPAPASVIMLVLDPTHDSILLSWEHRMSLDKMTVGLPSGIIDPGETPEQAAIRELKEETGLDAVKILQVLPASALTPGLTNDLTHMVLLEAQGSPTATLSFPEYIVSFWANKAEVKALMTSQTLLWTSHAQAALMTWAML